jgi:hypothetical protein
MVQFSQETLKTLAAYFGVTVADIRTMNSWLGATGAPHPGETLRIPPPTKP